MQRSLLPFILLSLCFARPARATDPADAFFDATRPAFVCRDHPEIVPIELAGAPALALVNSGMLLNGTEPCRPPAVPHALYLLRSLDDGRWEALQAIGSEAGMYGLRVLDVDGDGREDALAIATSSPPRLLFFRQDAGGRLRPPEELDLPEDLVGPMMCASGEPGAIMVLGRNTGGRGIWAARVEWSAEAGLRASWADWTCAADTLFTRPIAWIPYHDKGAVLIQEGGIDEPRRLLTLRLDDREWLETTSPARMYPEERPFLIRSGEGWRAYFWLSSPDSLYALACNDDGGIVLHAMPIDGVPADWRGGSPSGAAEVFQNGDPPLLAKAGAVGGGNEPAVGFVELREDGSARWAGRWEHAPHSMFAPLAGLYRDARGRLYSLHDVNGAVCAVSGDGEPPPVDLAASISPIGFRLYTDLTGDGIADLVLRLFEHDRFRCCFLRGIARAPWFADPVPIDDGFPSAGLTGDFDGDGIMDAVLQATENDTTTFVVPMSFDGTTLRTWDTEHVHPQHSSLRSGDYDGDGKDELLALHDTGDDHEWIAWGRDRRIAQDIALTGPVWNPVGAGDIDADGVDELLVWEGELSVVRCLPAEGRLERAWLLPGITHTLWDAAIVNLDPNPADEMIWSDFDHIEIWRSDGAGRMPRCSTLSYLVRTGMEGYLGAADLACDGQPEMVCERYGAMTVLADPFTSIRETTWVLPEILAGLLPEPLIGDVDGDGDPDLLIVREDGIRVQLNPAMGRSPASLETLRLRLSAANPLHDEVRVLLRSADALTVHLALVDATGRAWWRQSRALAAASWTPVEVPETIFTRLSSGAYWISAETEGRSASLRLVLVR